MTRMILALAAATAMTASMATAQDAPMAEDTDGDGYYSLEELQAVYPDLTAEVYATLDTNADTYVDEAEVTAGVDTGLLMAPG